MNSPQHMPIGPLPQRRLWRRPLNDEPLILARAHLEHLVAIINLSLSFRIDRTAQIIPVLIIHLGDIAVRAAFIAAFASLALNVTRFRVG